MRIKRNEGMWDGLKTSLTGEKLEAVCPVFYTALYVFV